MKQTFLVLGLGRFGKSVLKELSDFGHDVVGCDRDERTFDEPEVQEKASYLVQGDSTSQSFLEELDVHQFDAVIVSIGDHFESAILTVLALKEMGCDTIYAKANDKKRGKGLSAAGATKVIFPEEETGRRVARTISNPNILQYVQLATHFVGMEMPIPRDFIGHSLHQIDFRRKYQALVLMIKQRDNEVPLVSPNPDYIFQEGDSIFFVGDEKQMEKLRKKWD